MRTSQKKLSQKISVSCLKFRDFSTNVPSTKISIAQASFLGLGIHIISTNISLAQASFSNKELNYP
jgi:hypothetical protein